MNKRLVLEVLQTIMIASFAFISGASCQSFILGTNPTFAVTLIPCIAAALCCCGIAILIKFHGLDE